MITSLALILSVRSRSISFDIYLWLSFECIQNTSGKEPPCAPASSMVQYSFQLVTEILVLIPVLAVKSAIISLSPGSWLLSQIETLRVTSELVLFAELFVLVEPVCAALPDLAELLVLVVLPEPPQAVREKVIAPAKSNDRTFFIFMGHSSFKLNNKFR